MNSLGNGFGVVKSPHLPVQRYLCRIRSKWGAKASFIVSPSVLVGEPSVYKTGFPEDWRSHRKCDF